MIIRKSFLALKHQLDLTNTFVSTSHCYLKYWFCPTTVGILSSSFRYFNNSNSSQLVRQSVRDLQEKHKNVQDSMVQTRMDLSSLRSVDDVLTVGTRDKLPLTEMERVLNHLLHIVKYKLTLSVAEDSRFSNFLSIISRDLKHGSAYTVTRILSHLLYVPSCAARTSLASQCARFAAGRPNAFCPVTFVEYVNYIARLGIIDVEFIEFVRTEALHLMTEFGPHELVTLLDSIHRLRLYNRQLIDLIVEQMNDELYRYTPMDIVRSLDTIAKMGLVRTHITRQLASLALTNIDQLTSTELCSVASSLGRLRFIEADDFLKIVEIVMKTPQTKGLHELCFTSTLIKDLSPTEKLIRLIKLMIPTNSILGPHNAIPALAGIYTAMNFQVKDVYQSFKVIVPELLKHLNTSDRDVFAILSEILTTMKIEHSSIAFPISKSLLSQIKEYEKSQSARLDALRPLAELSTVLSCLSGKYKLTYQRGALADSYYVQLLNPETKIVIELETPQNVTNYRLKHRHLSSLGYRPIKIDLWKWKSLKTEEQQMECLKHLLRPHLINAKILNPKTDTASSTGVRHTATFVGSRLREMSAEAYHS